MRIADSFTGFLEMCLEDAWLVAGADPDPLERVGLGALAQGAHAPAKRLSQAIGELADGPIRGWNLSRRAHAATRGALPIHATNERVLLLSRSFNVLEYPADGDWRTVKDLELAQYIFKRAAFMFRP